MTKTAVFGIFETRTQAEDSGEIDEAKEMLKKNGGEDISSSVEAFAKTSSSRKVG